MSITPVTVDAGHTDEPDDWKKAYDQLVELAGEQRKRSPFLSVAQAFDRAFKANPQLAARAHKRPAPTTAYAFPR